MSCKRINWNEVVHALKVDITRSRDVTFHLARVPEMAYISKPFPGAFSFETFQEGLLAVKLLAIANASQLYLF